MSDYTYAEIMKMQDEAVRRVEEMQKRAQAAVKNDAAGEKAERKPANSSEPKRVPMPPNWLDSLKNYADSAKVLHADNRETAKNVSFFDGIGEKLGKAFGAVNIDSDVSLILSLVLLLSEEGCDEALLLSLLYILT